MSEPVPGHERRIDYPFHPGAMPPLFGDTASVLVVDDDPTVVNLLTSMLESEGYHCERAANADEAMQRLADQDFALALVDVLMPGDTGLELIDRALEVDPFLAVVVVTAVDDPEIAEIALRTGAYGYLVKPFSYNEVAIAVSNAGRRRCLEIESAVYRRRLETRIEEQTVDLEDALVQLKAMHRSN